MASIVAYHADPDWFPLAPMSLDVFFVLSTFLVTTLLLDSLSRHGGPQGRRFFTRRVRRLAAGLAAMLLVVLALAAAGAFTNPDIGRTALGAALLHANVAQFGGDYFSAFAERNPLEHTWSLSVEEHFYLATFAAVAITWLLSRRDLRRTRIALVALAGVVALGAVLSSRHLLSVGADPNRIYMGTDTRSVAAAAGVALAALRWGRWDLPGRLGRAVSAGAWALAAAVVFVVLLGWRPTLDWYAGGGWAVTALGATVVVAAAARHRRAGSVSANPLLQWAGRRSYGIYLWHLPLLVLLAEAGTTGVVVALAATAVAAELSHHLVEVRFRSGWPGDRAFVPAAVATFAAVAVFAVALPQAERPEWATEPIAQRDDPPPTTPPPAPPGSGRRAGPGTGADPGAGAIGITVWGDASALLVGAQLESDERFEVEVQAQPDCTEAASCTDRVPIVGEGTGPVVLSIADVAPFHPRSSNEWDLEAPERNAAELWLRLTTAAQGRPLALAMAPDARRDLGVGLHLRRMAADDPANLVLDAEPLQWPDALADRFATESAPTKVMVVGDSVAYSLATAFRPPGTVVWDQSRHGCDPSPGERVSIREGRDRKPSACDWRADWARAVRAWDPDVVVWHTGTWSTYDRQLDGRHLSAGSPEWHEAVASAHAEALGILAGQGARVVLAVTAPAWETARGKPVETTPEESARRMPMVLRAARDAASGFADVTVLDAADAVCDPDCDRPDLRDDGVHYSAEGARKVSAWLAQAGGF